jgi:hypothetical protein
VSADKPVVPASTAELAAAIDALLAAVEDSAVTLGIETDGYGKCVEAMWRAAYMAHEMVAAKLGVTGFQHGHSSLVLVGKLHDLKGPYMLIDIEQALYPQYDLGGRVAEYLATTATRTWLADEAQKRLDLHNQGGSGGGHAVPVVVEHWRKLVANRPE